MTVTEELGVSVTDHVQPVSVVRPHVGVWDLGHVTPLWTHLGALHRVPGPVQGPVDGHSHDPGINRGVRELELEIADLQEVLYINLETRLLLQLSPCCRGNLFPRLNLLNF